jgi:vacuolar-type H+-ATPase subunit H
MLIWPVVTNKWTWIGLTVLGLSGGVGVQTQRLRFTQEEVVGLQAQLDLALEVNQQQSRLISEQNHAVQKLKQDYDESQVRLTQAESQASSLLETARQKASEMSKQHVPRECDKAFKWAVQQEIQTRQARSR